MPDTFPSSLWKTSCFNSVSSKFSSIPIVPPYENSSMIG
nr:MAG TPA: hypothetical protein [Caudoviricetes sp.]